MISLKFCLEISWKFTLKNPWNFTSKILEIFPWNFLKKSVEKIYKNHRNFTWKKFCKITYKTLKISDFQFFKFLIKISVWTWIKYLGWQSSNDTIFMALVWEITFWVKKASDKCNNILHNWNIYIYLLSEATETFIY